MAGDGSDSRLERVMRADFMRTPPRPGAGDAGGRRYLRSYLRLRFFIGVIGVALPFVLVGARLAAGDGVQGSLSAYYWTGMRDLFVGACVAIGVFLAFYLVSLRNLDNYASYVAGAAVLVVAFFPTEGPAGTDHPTARIVAHYVAACVFILALAAISFRFGWAERHSDDPNFAPHPRAGLLHYGCAAGIVVAIAFVVASQVLGLLTDWSILIGETVSVLEFGASWLAKGLALFRPPAGG